MGTEFLCLHVTVDMSWPIYLVYYDLIW
jgi:hypothetical protein